MIAVGVAISAGALHAVATRRRGVVRTASARWDRHPDFETAFSSLLKALGPGRSRIRIVLERDLVQIRVIPRSRARESEYRAQSLFRNLDDALVTDRVAVDKGRSLLMVAADGRLVEAVLTGANAAGVRVDNLGVASEVLPSAAARLRPTLVFERRPGVEQLTVDKRKVVRSRLLRTGDVAPTALAHALSALGEDAPAYASAFAAARRRGKLRLRPASSLEAVGRQRRRNLLAGAAATALAWVCAGAAYLYALNRDIERMKIEQQQLARPLANALQSRLELLRHQKVIHAVSAVTDHRVSQLRHLEVLTTGLPDSAYLESIEFRSDGSATISGWAPDAIQILAELERLRGVSRPNLSGSDATTLESGRERFTAHFVWAEP